MHPLRIEQEPTSVAACGSVSQFEQRRYPSGHCRHRAQKRDYRRMPLIRLNDAAFMPDLLGALRDAGCLTTTVRGDACLVSPPPAEEQNFALELTFFVRAWLARNPLAEAELVA
jgi:hypothetical protein